MTINPFSKNALATRTVRHSGKSSIRAPPRAAHASTLQLNADYIPWPKTWSTPPAAGLPLRPAAARTSTARRPRGRCRPGVQLSWPTPLSSVSRGWPPALRMASIMRCVCRTGTTSSAVAVPGPDGHVRQAGRRTNRRPRRRLVRPPPTARPDECPTPNCHNRPSTTPSDTAWREIDGKLVDHFVQNIDHTPAFASRAVAAAPAGRRRTASQTHTCSSRH